MQQDFFLLQSASIVLCDLYVGFPMLDFNLYCRSSVITFFHSNSLKCTVLSYWFDYSALGQCKLNHTMSIPYLILLVECTSGYLHSAPKCLANKQGVKQGPVWRLERERGISFCKILSCDCRCAQSKQLTVTWEINKSGTISLRLYPCACHRRASCG
jgi:hypothetical protein